MNLPRSDMAPGEQITLGNSSASRGKSPSSCAALEVETCDTETRQTLHRKKNYMHLRFSLNGDIRRSRASFQVRSPSRRSGTYLEGQPLLPN